MSVPDVDPQQLIKRVGRALLGAAPANWKQIRAEYRSVGRHIEADVTVTSDDDQQYPIRPPLDVVELLGELRALMYRPGRGTWLSGRYVLDHPSKYNAEFEPDIEPRWRRVPPPIGFQDELRRFPREDAHIPEWLRARAGLPPIADTTATPPDGIPLPATPGPAASSPTSTPQPAAPPPGQPGAPGHQPGHPGQGAPAGPPPGTSGPTGTTPGGLPKRPRHTPPGGLPVPPPAPGHTPPGGLPRPPGPRPEGAQPAGPASTPSDGAPAPHGH
jgi:hypothetical protein